MEIVARSDIEDLLKKHKVPCVSIFMPTHRAGRETQEDPIRLKNLLRDADHLLIARGLRAPEAKDLLKPAQNLLQDGFFWRYQGDGLAMFISAEFFRWYRLPIRFDEVLAVAEHFHIKPLLSLLSGDGLFYILALSQNEVRLLLNTHFSTSEIDLKGVPENLAEALKFDDPERQLQFHTGTAERPGRRGERAAVFHGHGVGTDDTKDRILRYFREVDRGLHNWFKDERAPLMLAATDYLMPIYREANTYPNLVDEGISGNPEELSAKELHDQAWKIIQPYFLSAQEGALKKYGQLAGTERVSKNLKKIVPAAHQGRIDTVFVGLGLQWWGAFDPASGSVEIHDRMRPGDQDLLDFIAVQTFLQGGTVYVVEPEKIPEEKSVVAILRY